LAKTLNQLSTRAALVEAARDFHSRGWMLGTAGNLSARCLATDSNAFWITASGLPKGSLEESDFLCVDIASGELALLNHTDAKPSAETTIHQTIYRLFPHAHCCMHVHSVEASLAVARHAAGSSHLLLPELEMIKGFGIWEEHPRVLLPVFENHLSVPQIAQDIESYYRVNNPALNALMIRNHGITVWGPSIQETYNRVELIEFILCYLSKL